MSIGAQDVKVLITRKLSMLELTLLLKGYIKSCDLVLMVISDVTLGNWVKVNQCGQQKHICKSAPKNGAC